LVVRNRSTSDVGPDSFDLVGFDRVGRDEVRRAVAVPARAAAAFVRAFVPPEPDRDRGGLIVVVTA
jgi:hypothetical protein